MSEVEQPPWVEAALAEYAAHRAEVVAESQAQQHILALGATALGVVIAGTFNVWDDQLLATASFLVVVPLLTYMVLVQWVGRAASMMRVGVYLEELEATLADQTKAPAPVLTWETTLVKMRPGDPDRPAWRPQAGWNDYSAVGVFGLLAAGSIALGTYRGWHGHALEVGVVALVQVAVFAVVVPVIAWRAATARMHARKNFPTVAGQAPGAQASRLDR